MKNTSEKYFAIVAPGLEGVCARELVVLGMDGVCILPGGVEFSGDRRDLYRANLWLRTASRVVVRIGEVKVRDFPDLFRKTVRMPWGKYVRSDTRLSVRATSRHSRLVHSGRISATVSEAVDRALGRRELPDGGSEQLILARFENDVCTLSIDSSGALLHRRGYREETAHAPLRETLAAGILLLLGWYGTVPLVDPMCGSGTFAIEGALLAQNRPPGMERSFAFMGWPHYRPGLWEALLGDARRAVRKAPAAICAADYDLGAVTAARRNAARAGVLEAIDFSLQELSRQAPPSGSGLVVCNPPYGERVGKGCDLRPLFRSLGQVFREQFHHWRGAFLCPDDRLARATGLPLSRAALLTNGGIPVALYTTPSVKADSP